LCVTAIPFRGVKAKVAQDHAAIGCIIYSDPADERLRAGRRLSERTLAFRVTAGQRGWSSFLFISGRSFDARVSLGRDPGRAPDSTLEESYGDNSQNSGTPLAYDQARD